MKIRISISLLVLGYALDFIGAWFKITHQSPADLTLAIAAILKVAGLVLFAFFMLSHPKVKAFLDYDEHKEAFK